MKQLIDQTISNITAYPDDELVHMLKCASSTTSAVDKKLFKPLISAIEKERRKRGTASTISTKIPSLKGEATASKDDKPANGANPDDY